jgi:hypothetical protein
MDGAGAGPAAAPPAHSALEHVLGVDDVARAIASFAPLFGVSAAVLRASKSLCARSLALVSAAHDVVVESDDLAPRSAAPLLDLLLGQHRPGHLQRLKLDLGAHPWARPLLMQGGWAGLRELVIELSGGPADAELVSPCAQVIRRSARQLMRVWLATSDGPMHVTEADAAALCGALRDCQLLTHLGVNAELVQHDWAAAAVAAPFLHDRAALVRLDVGSFAEGDDGGVLAYTLSHSSLRSLQHLGLAGYRLRHDAARRRELAAAVTTVSQQTPSLTSMRLWACDLPLGPLPHLRKLVVRDCTSRRSYVDAIMQAPALVQLELAIPHPHP